MEGWTSKSVFRSISASREKTSVVRFSVRLAKEPPLTGDQMFQASLELSIPCMENGHDKFSGTISDLKSKASLGCQACSIVYNGLTTLDGPCSDFSNCTVAWKPQGKATLAVLVRHRCDPKYKPETPRAIEFIHNIGPFDTLEEMPNIRFGSIVPENPEESMQTMLEWITNCETTHIACKPSKEPQLPRRVLDVQNWQNSIRLYESHGECSRYVALSHRWGANQLLKTTMSSLESRKKAIGWTELSQTFQDAIIFTARLGVRYLWIDSLCIIQDSKKDWQEESSKMASIYENAFVTLAANRSEDNSKGGLFAPRITKLATMQLDFFGRPTMSVLVREAIKHDQFYEGSEMNERHSSYPLFQRAWCFQERILATRILHFTKNEVVFECKTGCKCECTSIGLRGDSLIKAYYQELFAGKYYVNSWVGWRTVVTDYSKNRLTDSRDVLPALSGISSRLQCEELGAFHAGLWEKELIHGLFWYTRVSAAISNPIYTGPSYSWVSLIGRADFKDLQWTDSYRGSSDIREPNFKLVNATCWIKGSNPYGEVSKGIVELKARCHTIILSHHPGKRHPKMQVIWQQDPTSPYSWPSDNIPERRTSTERVFLDCGKMSVETVSKQQLTCIIGFWNNYKGNYLSKIGTGLLIEKLPGDLLYRRVGYFERLPAPEERFELLYGSERIVKIC